MEVWYKQELDLSILDYVLFYCQAFVNMRTSVYAQPDDLSNWNVTNTGLKIESLGQEIGVILRTSKGAVAETALLVHPDDILGDSYRLFFFHETDSKSH